MAPHPQYDWIWIRWLAGFLVLCTTLFVFSATIYFWSSPAPPPLYGREPMPPAPRGIIQGEVLGHDGRPCAMAYVECRPKETGPPNPPFPFDLWSETFESWAQLRSDPTAQSDEQGRFLLAEVPPGTWQVRATIGPGIRSAPIDVTVEESETLAGIELSLPEFGWLSGRLMAPAGSDFESLQIWARPAEMVHSLARRQSPIEPDGSFRLGPLPLGINEFTLSSCANESSGGNEREALSSLFTSSPKGAGPSLGTLRIEGGGNRHEFDIADLIPGTLSLRVVVDGKPRSGLWITAYSGEDSSPDRSGAKSGADGWAHLELFPGTWSLSVGTGFPRSGRENSWSAALQGEVRILPGQEVVLEEEVAVHEHAVTCVDLDTGRPLVSTKVRLWLTGPRGKTLSHHLTTDHEARLSLVHPPGEFVLQRAEGPDWTTTPGILVRWSSIGPDPETVRLPRPEASGR